MTQKLLIIGLVWPEPNSSAAGTRMLQLIDLFQKNNFEITFACAATNLEFSFDVTTIGVKKQIIELNNSSFDVFVKNLTPNIVLFDRFVVDEIEELTVNSWPKFEDRSDFIFIGNFLHEPNWNTVQFLKESIWPLIRKVLPEASMKIYGAYPSQKVQQLHNHKERFLILGRAANASVVIKYAKVVLAPIRFGAGAKGKLIEAMQCGTPSITTTIGAESMNGDLPWNGIIADEIQEICASAIQLYQDENLWKTAQQNGIKIVNERFSKVLFEDDVIKTICQLQENLLNHRLHNFYGTKYMSKWIEEKNRK